MTELTYSYVGDYYLPDLMLPQHGTIPIGKYGLLHRTYLKTHRRIFYTNLLTAGTLHKHLAEIGGRASECIDLLIHQMAAAQNVTEKLKATDQMAWVSAMNNIKACAEEIVLKEIIYA